MEKKSSLLKAIGLQRNKPDLTEIRRAIRQRKFKKAKEILQNFHPADIAELLTETDPLERKVLFGLLPVEVQSEVLSYLPEEASKRLLATLSRPKQVKLIENMSPDDAADLLEEVPRSVRKNILRLLNKEEKHTLKKLLSYPPETAGGVMTPLFIALNKEDTVSDAIKKIRKEEEDVPLFHIYVVDQKGKLLGIVPLRKLITSPPNKKLEELLQKAIAVKVNQDREEAARIMEKYDLIALPVVDRRGKLLGVITADDAMDVLEEEAAEDMYYMAGSSPKQEEDRNMFSIVLLRLPWLLISLVGELISGLIIKNFEPTLSKLIALAAFIPLIMAMGGNAGMQSAMTSLRKLTLGKKIAPALFKEIGIGWLVGACTGLVVGVLAHLTYGKATLGLIIFLSMSLAVSFSALVGALLPVIFSGVGIDPAIATGPFVTSINDIIGIGVYLTLATILLKFLKI